MYAFLARVWKHDDFASVHVQTRGAGKEAVKVYSPPPEVYRSAARLLLLQDAQASIGESSLEGLATQNQEARPGRICGEDDHHNRQPAEEVFAGGVRRGRTTRFPTASSSGQTIS
jgi:hypothetical protein